MHNEAEDIYISRSSFIKCKKGNIRDFYNLQKKPLGRGAYGTVYKGNLKNTQKIRAVKQIKKSAIKFPQTFINQIEILKKLDHPNIIKIYQTFEDNETYYIVTDFCEGGELFDRLSEEGNFSETNAREIFKQILYAIKYCHIQKIAHRDLKPQNFLFMNKNEFFLKVIDFGLSYEWKENMNKELKEKKDKKLIGTSYYIAPQILKGDYDERCDIWSLGVILYILVTAVPPFDGQTDKEIIQAVRKGVYYLQIPEMKKISKELKDLIKKILVPASERLTIQQIFQHPWMRADDLNKIQLKLNFGKIMNFSQYSKLKTLTVSYIATQMPGKQIQKLATIFKQIDLNNDGFISMEELKIALQKQNEKISTPELERLIHYIDTDHNGKINYSQFVACSMENQMIFKEENLLTTFKMLDTDNSGTVTPAQLKQAFENMNSSLKSEVIDQIIKECDKNNDGVIDFNEFLSFISQI